VLNNLGQQGACAEVTSEATGATLTAEALSVRVQTCRMSRIKNVLALAS
jgi:hypothetical protein